MTDEQQEVRETKDCECKCKCHKALCKFVLITSSVFVGTLLAILVAASLLKPPIPCPQNIAPMPMIAPNIQVERQLAPREMMPPSEGRAFRSNKFHHERLARPENPEPRK